MSDTPTLRPEHIEILDWIAANSAGSDTERLVRTLAALARLGQTDPDAALDVPPWHEKALVELARLHPGSLRDETLDLDLLAKVGAHAYEDASNWLPVADALETWVSQRSIVAAHVIDAWVEAGWTPKDALMVTAAANAANIEPNTFDPRRLTPQRIVALIRAGVRGDSDVDGYRLAGVGGDGMIALASAGVSPGAAVAGVELGVPRDDWPEVFAGMDPSWFPIPDRFSRWEGWSPVTNGAMGRTEGTLDDLKRLRDLGWGDVPAHELAGVYRAGKRAPLDARRAIMLAERGWRPQEYAAMVIEMTVGRHHSDTPPPLLHRGWHPETCVTTAIALRDAGVKPSDIKAYRYAGCRSVEDVVAAAAAGITGKIASQMCRVYGAVRGSGNPRISSLEVLLEAFEHSEAARHDGVKES